MCGRLGVAEIGKRDEAVFQRINQVEHITRLIVGEMASELQFNASKVEPVNLKAQALEFGNGRFGNHVREAINLAPPHPL
jgi:hypothetical protein